MFFEMFVRFVLFCHISLLKYLPFSIIVFKLANSVKKVCSINTQTLICTCSLDSLLRWKTCQNLQNIQWQLIAYNHLILLKPVVTFCILTKFSRSDPFLSSIKKLNNITYFYVQLLWKLYYYLFVNYISILHREI